MQKLRGCKSREVTILQGQNGKQERSYQNLDRAPAWKGFPDRCWGLHKGVVLDRENTHPLISYPSYLLANLHLTSAPENLWGSPECIWSGPHYLAVLSTQRRKRKGSRMEKRGSKFFPLHPKMRQYFEHLL